MKIEPNPGQSTTTKMAYMMMAHAKRYGWKRTEKEKKERETYAQTKRKKLVFRLDDEI